MKSLLVRWIKLALALLLQLLMDSQAELLLLTLHSKGHNRHSVGLDAKDQIVLLSKYIALYIILCLFICPLQIYSYKSWIYNERLEDCILLCFSVIMCALKSA
ncbi:hypothetical protein NQD34_003203 [Periophthalmus magnuspinnatus]|nr:hypothetical protein NQD34_003203 [Periophthalmus magnuspinnatus]